ncbi:MAG TPA: phosphoribosylformylglycinamidine synthase subunit PurL [Trueperaceae bacterium]|nr:phosphoribosylformylglycinamidine synthase subunit PurL [Trueperaceae bacterium]
MSIRERAAGFGLNEDEFDLVERHLGREPNALEAGVFGALWSEHCGYKNSRPLLRRLPTEGPQVLQGPGENAGVVDVGDGWAVAFKMESHNHPSAVEPVQGAATGVGGILRDIFAMGARPVAVLDSLRFGEPTEARNRFLLHGVVEGISLYGNAIGVPTVGGEIAFHPCYQENPLVNVMALGLLRHDELKRGTVGEVGNSLIYVGSKTGRDGLGGAVFASADLSEASDADRPAVQVGDPFMEKLLLEACLEAYARGLVAGVQDMGAAGLSSSVAEMAHRAELGVDLYLDRVPRREEGMSALEVMLSESQERMLLTATPGREEDLLALLEHWELDAHVIGVVKPHGRLRLYEGQHLVGDLPVAALNEPPTYIREGVEDEEVVRLRSTPVDVPETADPAGALLRLLESPTVASKEAVYRRYDHQVMTNTVVLPGQADAAVLRIKGSPLGVAATVDCNARYVRLEPRLGAAHAVAEAARNLSCVGATPLGVTDNLNFGNPYLPEVYYQLEEAIEGLRDACLALGTPVTGGNVSLYNQYRDGTGYRAIHPTPTVGMVGVLPDATRRATMGLKRDGDVILLIGEAAGELGASEMLYRLHGLELGAPPALDLEREAAVQRLVRGLVQDGVCDTAHDISEGGLAVALAEMAMAGGRGLDASLPSEPGVRDDALLFGEAPARVLLAVPGESAAERAEALCRAAGVPCLRLGVSGGDALRLRTARGAFAVPLASLLAAYHRPLSEALG